MEILFLVHRAPWPPDRGDRIRSWHLLRALAAIAPVHVVAFADSDADATTACKAIGAIARSCHVETRRASPVSAVLRSVPRGQPLSLGLFASRSMQAHVDSLLRGGAITDIVAFSSQMAAYVPRDWQGRFLMDFVDVDSAKFAAYAQADAALSPMRLVHGYEARHLAAWEQAVARRADVSTFVSEAEAALFCQRADVPAQRVIALENGIDLRHFAPDATAPAPAPRPLIVFTGQMDYRPNIDAVADFARNSLPLIREHQADACFAIVGRAPTKEVRALASLPGVIVTGEVPDTRPWLAAADVVVAPLAVARGIQNKLLEAMAMGRPVVTSGAAAQGIDAQDGRDWLVADTAQGRAQAVLSLLASPERAAAIGAAARRRMEQRYDWGATLAPLAKLLR